MKTVITKKIAVGVVFWGVMLLGVGGCVSIKSYRRAKAQMIYSELVVARQQKALDSLQVLYNDIKSRTTEAGVSSAELQELKTQLSRLQVEHVLMQQELEDFRNMQQN